MGNQKVALITGGSDGIGKALCLEYGRRGYAIAFTGRSMDKLQQTSEVLNAAGIKHKFFQLDAAVDEDNQKLVTGTMDWMGRIDVLICNAGISMRILFQELSLETFERIMRINFRGVVALIHYALPHLVTSRGHIVGISSVNGRRATPARTAYVASKYAMEGFLESLRMELRSQDVRVLVVCPGFTKTNMRRSSLMPDGNEQGETKLNESKMMSPKSVAKKVYRAMERKKRDLVLTTEGRLVVWANKFFPSLVDKAVFHYMAQKPDSPFYEKK